MGNRLCKNKKQGGGDAVDNAKNVENGGETRTSKFDRIINRLHLKPTSWKSESQLNKKDANQRSKSVEPHKGSETIFYTKPLSKSSDWTSVDLEVPSKEDEHIHLRNPKLNFMFDNENGTPTPPPRNKQHKGTNLREKIEKIASKGLQAFQGDKTKDSKEEKKVPVEEPLMVKKKINYNCPVCDSDEKNHNRNHHHHGHGKKESESPKKSKATNKRLKNLSVVSLPNYTELKLSVAHPGTDEDKSSVKNDLNSSRLSLQHAKSKPLPSSQSTGRLDSYITRCRSFGSILPQQLKKLKTQKTKPEDITSDDSFGPLEDWDVGLIEHYNPKDASLPRPRKVVPEKSKDEVLEGIEGLIMTEKQIEEQNPTRPLRRSESLVKKINKEVSKQQAGQPVAKSPEDICLTPPPSPVQNEQEALVVGTGKKVAKLSKNFEDSSTKKVEVRILPGVKDGATVGKPEVLRRNILNKTEEKETKRGSVAEHSSLMRILQEFSVKDVQEKVATPPPAAENDSEFSSLTPSLVEFEKTLSNNITEDFINAEKRHTRAVCS